MMLKNFKFILLLVSVSVFLFFGVNSLSALYQDDELMQLVVGETKIIPTQTPTRIVIGNPAVADVVNVTLTEITFTAKSAGITTLVFWDAFGEQSAKIKVLSEDMQELKRRVDFLLAGLNLPEIYTQTADDEDKVMLLGRVRTAQDRERIITALGPLKDKILDLLSVKEEESVVEIDVQILELDKDATTTLGCTWPGRIEVAELGSPALTSTGAVSVSTIVGGPTAGTTRSYTETTPGTKFQYLFKVLNFTRDAFVWSLDALIQEGKARILSRPRLACQSGKEAELLVGGEKPTFATFTTNVSSGVRIEYKEYGIKLKIKPTVSEENRIKLALNVIVSELGEPEMIGSTTTVTGKAYPLTKRTASTELFLNDGQTMAIGGLIKQKTEEELRKFPWLADIPVLGLFFRHRTTKTGGGYGTKGDTELFITLTPTIVSYDRARIVAKKETKPKTISGSIVDRNLSQPVTRYATIVRQRISERILYPASAQETGFYGTVKLRLRLSSRGELIDAEVKESSGYKILDDDAIKTARQIGVYPPFPSSIEAEDLWIEVPIVYRLD